MTKAKKHYLIIFGIIALIIGQAVIRIIYSELHPSKEKVNKARVYNGEYKGRLEEKYPSYFKDMEIAREEINKSIKSHKSYRNQEKSNYIVTDYFDEKGRLVFSSEEYDEAEKRAETIGKSKDFYYQKYTPSEKGFIYDKDGKAVKKIVANGGMSYKAKTKDSKITFLKNYYTGVSVIKIKYLEDETREEEKESMGVITQNYEKIICKYKGDILLSEKILFDNESREGFIIATVEKKYNEKGELTYKTVERKDKTNDYRSFTEMDFAKDEIVTKYYKGKDVFATVTENLVGPVETIEETEMVKGEEVKKVYKNKVKAIVKRQKVGDTKVIYDEYDYSIQKDKAIQSIHDRYYYDDNNVKFVLTGVEEVGLSYLEGDRGLTETSYALEHFHFKNKDSIGLFNSAKLIYKYGDNKIEKRKFIKTKNIVMQYRENEIDIEKLKEETELISEEKEKNLETKKKLEELLNGYKYE